MSWVTGDHIIATGITPAAMIGHSIGEYVAACIAGVFTLSDALMLVAERGRLMFSLPAGQMLAVHAPQAEVQALLSDGMWIAAINTPGSCVVSTTVEAMPHLQERLASSAILSQPIETSHAFHSGMMDPILASFTEVFKGISLNAPQIPYISNETGTWITAADAMSPDYWVRHLRQPVHFAQGLHTLLNNDAVSGSISTSTSTFLLEIGPGRTLSGFARAIQDKVITASSLPSRKHPDQGLATSLQALGTLWQHGMGIDWKQYHQHQGQRRRRIGLPTYPF